MSGNPCRATCNVTHLTVAANRMISFQPSVSDSYIFEGYERSSPRNSSFMSSGDSQNYESMLASHSQQETKLSTDIYPSHNKGLFNLAKINGVFFFIVMTL